MIGTNFIFDGINSVDMGLHIIRLDAGMVSTPWGSGKDIIEEKTRYKQSPYFYGTQKQPLEFQLTFSLLYEKMTDTKKFELARWLFKDEYKEFQTTDYLGKVFYLIGINQTEFMTTDNDYGYFTINFRCADPFAWSKDYIDTFNLSNNSTKQIIEVANRSNVVDIYYPELQFKILEGTGIKLKNLSNKGQEFTFTNLNLNETVYVNNNLHQISSDQNLPRLGNFNKNWLGLTYGINRIEVTGKCNLNFRSKFPLYL